MLDPQPQFTLTNPTNFNEYFKPGPCAGFEVRLTGNADSGSVVPEDIASLIRVDRGGSNIIQQDSHFFFDWLQIPFGTLVEDTTDGGNQEIAFVVPFFIPEHPQVLEIGNNELYVSITFDESALGNHFTSADYTVEITPLYADRLTEDYTLRIQTDTLTQDDQETYAEPNHAHLLFREATSGSNDRVDITVDGEGIVDNGADLGHLQRQMSLWNNVESDTLPELIDYSLIQSGRLRDALNGRLHVQLKGTDGEDVDITRVRLDGASKGDMSLNRAQRTLRNRISNTPVVDEQTRRS